MDMYDPPHPGEIVREDCLKALDLTVTEAAKGLGVTRKTLSSILNGRSGITAEMALRLPMRSGARRSTGCRCSLPTICGRQSAAPRSCTSNSSSPPRPASGRGRGLRPSRGGKAAIIHGCGRDQSFDGYDHRKSLDLAGDDASGHLAAKIGQFPETGQDLVATKVQPAQPFGFLVHQPFPDGGAVLNHVGADARLGFGVGGGVGIEADSFRSAAVIHGSGQGSGEQRRFPDR